MVYTRAQVCEHPASVRPTPPPQRRSGWSTPTRGATPPPAGSNSLAVHSLHQPARYLLLFQGPQHAFPPVLPPLQVDHKDLRPRASVGPSRLGPGTCPRGKVPPTSSKPILSGVLVGTEMNCEGSEGGCFTGGQQSRGVTRESWRWRAPASLLMPPPQPLHGSVSPGCSAWC